ncbi:hypothetical protein [Bacillus sp. EB600]|uniref:HAAS signaling domain-containing protein n=1 Tax=Bacillus sp. EB600 TaxID=2806345 RepID=UPI00210A6B79|nr:hypothetical protein [Bacillus sp. EB600]MCQ6279139.1 hypothetical protein [Bacillus sp. EB600]
MERLKSRFLDELAKGLEDHQDKENILSEYEIHIDEIFIEILGEKKEATMELLISRLGEPNEIAEMWREELSFTPSRMKWLFILFNIFLFAGGSLLTLVHNLYEWKWLSIIWNHLTSIPTMIAFVYLFFWALLGYEIGRGFGHGGRILLRKTFLFSLIPNLMLMVLTVFKIIPHSWFAPLLTKSFIIACILFTIILYPVCILGYRWGKKASI